jgi:hypothetical protein
MTSYNSISLFIKLEGVVAKYIEAEVDRRKDGRRFHRNL